MKIQLEDLVVVPGYPDELLDIPLGYPRGDLCELIEQVLLGPGSEKVQGIARKDHDTAGGQADLSMPTMGVREECELQPDQTPSSMVGPESDG